MNTIDEVVSIMVGFVPYTDHGKEYVSKGVQLFLEGDEKKARLNFFLSGHGLKGLLYFAMRAYIPEEKELDVYNFIMKHFSHK